MTAIRLVCVCALSACDQKGGNRSKATFPVCVSQNDITSHQIYTHHQSPHTPFAGIDTVKHPISIRFTLTIPVSIAVVLVLVLVRSPHMAKMRQAMSSEAGRGR